jgi:hypothetical protein
MAREIARETCGEQKSKKAKVAKVSSYEVHRALGGTYVAVDPFHLIRYVDEQVFLYNNRGTRKEKISDSQRFD